MVKVLSVLNREERTTPEGGYDSSSVGEKGGDEDAEHGNKPASSSISESKEQVSRALLCLLPEAVPKQRSSISAAPHGCSRLTMTGAPVSSSKFEAHVEHEGVK